ncbi:MAG: alkaline phosphatase [Parvularculaceae bacterium]|nr:alkaline phosphatase [Parvularculaceae bacterium]
MTPRFLLLAAALPIVAPPFILSPADAQSGVSENPYFIDGQKTLSDHRAVKANRKRARNVILFIGDGMDPTTVAAARIYDGQARGEEGEENFLSFERFPYLAMSKTYNTDSQTPDSAGTASAMATGVKTKIGVISLDDNVIAGECASTAKSMVATIGELAESAGLATGIVSTSALTDATPAAFYAHAPSRRWQADIDLPDEAVRNGCTDIARQLIEFSHGDGVDVALGGGRRPFLPAGQADPEDAEITGARRDGRDLTAEWTAKGNNRLYVWDRKSFDAVDPAGAPKLLGLFEPTVMKYETDRADDAAGEPSIVEMTEKAIEILKNGDNGFFLMVEGGRIDHAHHQNNAARALREAQIFAEAVAKADAMTDDKDTLIIVTADHAHTLTFAGYPRKGANILGLVAASPEDENQREGYALAGDGKTYTTLGYAMGPGSLLTGQQKAGERHEPTAEEVADPGYRQQSAIPRSSETHGGQDVTIYAKGPHAYLFGGIVEQSYIYHVIDDALRLRRRAGK